MLCREESREQIEQQVDSLVQENEEFLAKFEDCKEAILEQVHSILFQFDKLKQLQQQTEQYYGKELQAFLQNSIQSMKKESSQVKLNLNQKLLEFRSNLNHKIVWLESLTTWVSLQSVAKGNSSFRQLAKQYFGSHHSVYSNNMSVQPTMCKNFLTSL